MEKHYLGLEYAKPLEAGLLSEAKAVGKRLKHIKVHCSLWPDNLIGAVLCVLSVVILVWGVLG